MERDHVDDIICIFGVALGRSGVDDAVLVSEDILTRHSILP